MNKESELNKICIYYEMFMERAYGIYDLPKPALQASAMRNLIIAEKGIVISLDSVAHFEEQLIEVKKSMEEAMDYYMAKPSFSQDMTELLQQFKSEIVWAVSSEELMRIVHKTIDVTAAVSIEMK
ncbi:MAG TPA: hypothetical protein VFG54_18165 [Prolixibacteraceae bacterium]|nr:hypothetical protein [Prolixibacteraceae bacterium]